MARNITLTLGAGLSSSLGPNFNLTADVGDVTPSTATKTELLLGKSVSVDDSATEVTITSVGVCTASITQMIVCDAILSFDQYYIGEFYFSLSSPISTTITIVDCGVIGYNGACDNSPGTDSMSTSGVINVGETSITVAGNTPLNCDNENYLQANNIRVNGSSILQDGDTITIGGVLITININHITGCSGNPYACE
jgi:hypothetical protein